MPFNEFGFWPFFAIVLAVVIANAWIFKSVRFQNLLLLTASYYFYAQWDFIFMPSTFI